MSSQNKKPEETPIAGQTQATSTVAFMFGTIADTTWRMFVPTIGLTFLGWSADKHWGTKPWLFILGVIVGASISALLVRRQLIRSQQS